MKLSEILIGKLPEREREGQESPTERIVLLPATDNKGVPCYPGRTSACSPAPLNLSLKEMMGVEFPVLGTFLFLSPASLTRITTEQLKSPILIQSIMENLPQHEPSHYPSSSDQSDIIQAISAISAIWTL